MRLAVVVPMCLLLVSPLFASAFAQEIVVQEAVEEAPNRNVAKRVAQYTSFRLQADLSTLSENQRKMLPLLIEAADLMDACFWYEACAGHAKLLESLDGAEREFLKMNYGPWDRLDDNRPFLNNIGPKPLGANFYPANMTKEEFQAADLSDKDSLYTFLRRDNDGKLITVPYRLQLAQYVEPAAKLLRKAAELAESAAFRQYLLLRADALLSDDYQPSDLAWLDMKDNAIDVVIGPIETYEDRLFGYKAAHECYVLIKDLQWSKRLERYAQFLPWLQEGLPVAPKYKQEKPGNDTDLNAYDVVYYAGDCNAGSKTIAINLPNDEEVQLRKGTRRLQLKNAMKAKFDRILLPIADELIDEAQKKHISFNGFFSNTMFHEVAHGLGIKNTITGNGTVRGALKDAASAMEEGKADILGLYMIQRLHERGEITGSLEEYYTTFLAGIFRSVRFGSASAHGRANMIRFNFFKSAGAFERSDDGKYRVNGGNFSRATEALARKLLTLQGNGNYEAAKEFESQMGKMDDTLRADLERLDAVGIPVDVVFEQGIEVLGLSN